MAFAASSAADSCGCGGGDPPGTATVGRTKDCDPPDMVDSDAERLGGGEALSACEVAAQRLQCGHGWSKTVLWRIGRSARCEGLPSAWSRVLLRTWWKRMSTHSTEIETNSRNLGDCKC